MAKGDTKTEQLLDILGNGGSGDEFRGCCNTKTQGYILDAIDRINNISPSGGSGVRVLTTDDYNYPAGSPNSVGLWLLEDGLYSIDDGVDVQIATTSPRYLEQTLFAVNDSAGIKEITVLNSTPDIKSATYIVNGADGTLFESGYVLRNTMVIDDLNSSYTDSPLSSNQGKILGDRIKGSLTSAPTTSTKGVVGSLLATVESGTGHLYICTNVSGNTYTWQQLV